MLFDGPTAAPKPSLSLNVCICGWRQCSPFGEVFVGRAVLKVSLRNDNVNTWLPEAITEPC